MKLLLLMLALIIALPSVQAGGCAMGGAADSTEQAAGHDCCPGETEEAPEQEPPCDENGHCAGCFISVAVVAMELRPIEQKFPVTVFAVSLPALVPVHAAPPYRPPIS